METAREMTKDRKTKNLIEKCKKEKQNTQSQINTH